MATGDYEGKILIWKLSTGTKLMVLFHRADRYEASVDKLTWVTVSSDGNETALLLSAGGDGVVRVWSIEREPKLIATLDGAHGRLEQVQTATSLCLFGNLSSGIGDEDWARIRCNWGYCWSHKDS